MRYHQHRPRGEAVSLLHKKVSIRSLIEERDPRKQADEMLKLFTKVDWAGTREAISAFLTCPLLTNRWFVAWDLVMEQGFIQFGSRSGKHRPKPLKTIYPPSVPPPERDSHVEMLEREYRRRQIRLDHEARFRTNRLLYLSDAGTKYVAEKLGRVRAAYGWRSTDSDASGVKAQLEAITKRTQGLKKARLELEEVMS